MSEPGRDCQDTTDGVQVVGNSVALFERASSPIAAVRGTDDPNVDLDVEIVNRAYEAKFENSCADDDCNPTHEIALTETECDLVRTAQEGRADRGTVEKSTPRGRRRFAVEAVPAERPDLTAFLQYRDVTTEEIRKQQLAVLRRILRHDLRNDLAVLLGYTETIAERTDDPEMREQAVAMADAADGLRSVAASAGRLQCVTPATESASGGETTAVGDAIAKARRAITPELSDGFAIGGSVPSASVDRRVALALEELCKTLTNHSKPTSVRLSVDVDDGWASFRLDADVRLGDQEVAALEGRDETKLRHVTGISPWIAHWAVRAAGGRIHAEGNESSCTIGVEAPVVEPARTTRATPRQQSGQGAWSDD